MANQPSPVIEPGYTFGTVTDKISSIVLTRPTTNGWIVGFAAAFMLTMMLLYALGYLFLRGVGIWGINIPVGWGFAIINFVWWIGIGHAGTLISAILLLLRQSWRNSINRFAEAMTLFAVASAGIFPGVHTGREREILGGFDGRNDGRANLALGAEHTHSHGPTLASGPWDRTSRHCVHRGSKGAKG